MSLPAGGGHARTLKLRKRCGLGFRGFRFKGLGFNWGASGFRIAGAHFCLCSLVRLNAMILACSGQVQDLVVRVAEGSGLDLQCLPIGP